MSCNETIILKTRELTREVPKNGSVIRTVDSLTFEFNKGLVYNVVGPSGAGKSSFLRLLNRLDEPTGGEVLYYDKPVTSYAPTDLRRKISMLFQIPYLFPGTVRDNLSFCCSGKQEFDADFHLRRVGLKAEYADMGADDLSVGEKQRVALARSLFLEPDVLLLDEPTSALDPTSSRKIEELILSLARELCLTVIMVTHNPDQALRLGGKGLLMVKGKLIESGDTAELLTDPSSDLGRRYVSKELE
ncbi:MAG: phosphate ABC transporter ATP-binding protein [Candidatus Zixiibacteriota bacterium]|nr:MAG: phosphate ABC transporter ATP-binding protein [candidate division Zixibacteria bacterium]HDL04631.1 phosphate ABC transporter ATP-binding protein [candidate division Zixibacteria bacterium]